MKGSGTGGVGGGSCVQVGVEPPRCQFLHHGYGSLRGGGVGKRFNDRVERRAKRLLREGRGGATGAAWLSSSAKCRRLVVAARAVLESAIARSRSGLFTNTESADF